jgi:hypothetical protein
MMKHWPWSTTLTTTSLKEEEKDLNLSATNNTPTDKATAAENMPYNNTPTYKATTAENMAISGLHLIETFEEFEKGLLPQDYETTESQLDNPTHELLRWHYKLGHESFRLLMHM